jgi:hypothetical protein
MGEGGLDPLACDHRHPVTSSHTSAAEGAGETVGALTQLPERPPRHHATVVDDQSHVVCRVDIDGSHSHVDPLGDTPPKRPSQLIEVGEGHARKSTTGEMKLLATGYWLLAAGSSKGLTRFH